MPGICRFCHGSDRTGKVEHFHRRLKKWGWIPCPRCGGTRRERSVPTHREALAAREAKAS